MRAIVSLLLDEGQSVVCSGVIAPAVVDVPGRHPVCVRFHQGEIILALAA